MNTRAILTAVVLASALASGAARAAPVIYFGENQNPGQAVVGDPLTARLEFEANLTGVSSEGFESFDVGDTTPLDLTFTGSAGTLSAQITGGGEVFETPSAAGRYNTTGATAGPKAGKWWYVDPDSNEPFKITFATAISAFGFYGTDIGDFNGQVEIDLFDAVNPNLVAASYTVQNTINGADAALLFWGFIDSERSYSAIAFRNTAGEIDGFGFDDMIIGDSNQIIVTGPSVPEPATLALVGLALVGLAAGRRRVR